jgi:hypothetical protein
VVPLLGRGKAVVGVGDDPAGLVEPVEEAVPGAGGPRGDPLRPGYCPRALRQELGTEQLASDRAGEELVEGGAGAAGELAKRDAGDGELSGCGCDGVGERKLTTKGGRSNVAARGVPRSGRLSTRHRKGWPTTTGRPGGGY